MIYIVVAWIISIVTAFLIGVAAQSNYSRITFEKNEREFIKALTEREEVIAALREKIGEPETKITYFKTK